MPLALGTIVPTAAGDTLEPRGIPVPTGDTTGRSQRIGAQVAPVVGSGGGGLAAGGGAEQGFAQVLEGEGPDEFRSAFQDLPGFHLDA